MGRTKMRLGAVVAAILALPLLGMGMLGGGAAGAPERNYRGVFTDRDGTEVRASWVTAGGELAVAGELGRGSLRVPFDNVRRIEFRPDGDKGLVARVELRKGDPLDLRVRSSLAFSGRTEVGLYQIRARDLKAVAFEAE